MDDVVVRDAYRRLCKANRSIAEGLLTGARLGRGGRGLLLTLPTKLMRSGTACERSARRNHLARLLAKGLAWP